MSIKRSSGTNESERYLARLCESTFLNLWSYPNVFTNQGQKNSGDGKELCDLLVVCGDHIILFSDKRVTFKETGDMALDWSRWYRRAVLNSISKLLSKEKWLNVPERLFVDSRCTQPIPVNFPKLERRQVHFIAVASGSANQCRTYFRGGSGSLMIKPAIEETGSDGPFVIRDVGISNHYVHVFEEITLDIVLKELNTISDFISYLSKKEKFIRSGHFLGAAGEEELLAYYLSFTDKNGEHDFIPPSRLPQWNDHEMLSLVEGSWDDLRNSAEYREKKQADEISHLWDDLITKFTSHLLAGTSVVPEGDTLVVKEHERAFRYMAMEPRYHRRILSTIFYEAINRALPDKSSVRLIPPIREGYPAYVFMQCPIPQRFFSDYESYRNQRREILYAYCLVFKMKYPQYDRIIGIASEPPRFNMDNSISEDLILFELNGWTDKYEEEAKKIINHYKIDAGSLTNSTIDIHKYSVE